MIDLALGRETDGNNGIVSVSIFAKALQLVALFLGWWSPNFFFIRCNKQPKLGDTLTLQIIDAFSCQHNWSVASLQW